MRRCLIPALAILALAATPLLAGNIDWPKDSFTVDKLKEARELATKEKKPIAYIIMERGDEDRKERRKRDDVDQGDPSAAFTMTEDLAKDCARFAVVVNVKPSDLQTQPVPFTEKVYNAFSGALAAGTIPALVIADAEGGKIYAYAGAQEIQDDSSKILRDAKRNFKEGKEAEYKEPKKEKKGKKDDDE